MMGTKVSSSQSWLQVGDKSADYQASSYPRKSRWPLKILGRRFLRPEMEEAQP